MVDKKYFNLSSLILFLLALSCCLYLIDINSLYKLQLIQWLQIGLILVLSMNRMTISKIQTVIFCYVVSRTFLFFSTPLLEDDYYRYLWDGRVLANGISPYLLAPSDTFWDQVSSNWRQLINFPDVKTIYPPVTQIYFALVYLIFGESLLGLRIGALSIEIILSLLILNHLKKENLNLKPFYLFLFFPTLMKENINSVHFDLLATLFLFIFFIGLKKNASTLLYLFINWGSLAISVLVKIFPLVFLPVLFFRSPKKWMGLLIFFSLLLLFYFPFLDQELSIFSGTQAFAKNWLFFESLAYYVQEFFNLLKITFNIENVFLLQMIQEGTLTRLILASLLSVFILFVSLYKRISLQNKITVILLMLYACSTVLNTWYWLWILPFLILFAPRASWVLPVFTSLGYSWFISEDLYRQLHQPLYGFFILGLIFYILRNNYDGLRKWKLS